MKRRVRAKSALFLQELMISMLFFLLTAACCVQVFTKAHLMSRRANDLNMAVSCASNAAELLNHLGDGEEFAEKLDGSQCTAENQYQVWYDENWNVCDEEYAYAGMEIVVTQEDGMRSGNISVMRCGEPEALYAMEAGCYMQKTEEAGDDGE